MAEVRQRLSERDHGRASPQRLSRDRRELDDALPGADRFSREQPGPGDYYVVEVLERLQG